MTFATKLKFYPFLLLSKTGLIPPMRRFKIPELNLMIASADLESVESEEIYYQFTGYFNVARKRRDGLADDDRGGSGVHRGGGGMASPATHSRS